MAFCFSVRFRFLQLRLDCKGFCIVFAFEELHLFHKNNHYKSQFNAKSTIQTIFKKRTYRWT